MRKFAIVFGILLLSAVTLQSCSDSTEEVTCGSSGTVEYIHEAGVTNADCIVPGVCITRDGSRPLFNSATEFYWMDRSPDRTFWAPYECAVAIKNTNAFDNFEDAIGGNIGDVIVDLTMCLWLPSEGLMYDVVFTAWGSGGDDSGGTFTYERTAFVADECGHADATCIKGEGGTTGCVCPEGYVNDATTGICRKADPCDPNPCGTGATCVALGSKNHVCQCGAVDFYKPPTETATVDEISDDVWLARDDEYPIYNTLEESSSRSCGNTITYTEWVGMPCTETAPADFGLFLDDHDDSTFASCGALPETLLGKHGCLRLTETDEYWDILFNSWCRSSGGCFGYTRWHGVPDAVACATIPTIAYSGDSFTEAVANDGTITDTLTATVSNDTLSKSSGAFVLDTDYALSGSDVPTGLTLVVTATSATTATISFTGTADDHENSDSVSGIVITFLSNAFTSGVPPVAGTRSLSMDVNFDDNP